MAAATSPSPFQWLLAVLLLAVPASCGSLAAWWVNDKGPSLIMQDDASGGIRYSLCNTNSTPIMPNDTTLVAPLSASYPPKANTSLAGAGWWTGTDYFASIFYQDTQDRIVNSLLQCDSGTGQWYDTGDYVVSDDGPKVSPTSGLAVILLGSDDGYRVFYHDLEGRVQSVAYMASTAKWLYNGVVTPDVGNSSEVSHVIAAVNPGDTNITVITPRDGENMEQSRAYADDSWHIATFPTPLTNQGPSDSFYTNATNTTTASSFKLNTTSAATTWTLPAWDGQPAALAMAEDKQYTRSVFYIGTDQKLHQVGNVDWEWRAFDDQADDVWPAADDGYLALANDFASSQARVYYVSNGSVVEASSSSGIWAVAKTLDSYNATEAAAAAGAGNTTDTEGGDSGDTGGGSSLSSGAKAGIGVGVSLGVFAVGGSLAAFFLMRRSQRKKDAEREKADLALQSEYYGGGGSPANQPQGAYYPMGGYPPQQQQQGGVVQDNQYWGAKPGDAAANNQNHIGVPPPPVEAETSPIYEMDAHHRPTEMDAHYKPPEMMGEGHYQEMGADQDHQSGRR